MGHLLRYHGRRTLIPSQRDTSVRPFTSERFTVNSAEHPPTPVTLFSLAGFRYKLPPLKVLRPVVAIRAYTSASSLQVLVVDGQELATPGTYVDWFITLREPDGKFILKDAPLQMFAVPIAPAGAFPNAQWPLFIAEMLVDPRQSFVYCTVDGNRDLLCIEFLYR